MSNIGMLSIAFWAILSSPSDVALLSGKQDDPVVVLIREKDGFFVIKRVSKTSNEIDLIRIEVYLEKRVSHELSTISRVCSIDENLLESLRWILARDISMKLKSAQAFADGLVQPGMVLDNAILPHVRQLRDEMLVECFSIGSLGQKFLENRLDDHQKELLHEHYMRKTIDYLFSGVRISNLKREAFAHLVSNAAKQQSGFIFNCGRFLEILQTIDQPRLVSVFGEVDGNVIRRVISASPQRLTFTHSAVEIDVVE